MGEKTNIHFDGLNTLRFFSAFAVIIYHTTLSFQDSFSKPIKMLLHNLPLGVDFFFIISGFLIVYLLLVEKQTTYTISLSKFYIRRILRICPLYFLIVGIAYAQYRNSGSVIDFGKYIYFAGNFWMISIETWTVSILNPLWSLCIEEHFYLLVPILILLVPTNKVPHLFWSIISVSLLYRCHVALNVHSWMSLYCHTLSRCDLLAAGGLLAYYKQQGRLKFHVKGRYLLLTLVYLLLLMIMIDSSEYPDLVHAIFKKYLFAVPLLVIFSGIVLNTYNNNTMLSLKRNKVINYLGKISFGLYMYHSPVAEVVAKIPHVLTNLPLLLLLVITATIAVATISYEFFEKQILGYKKYFEVLKTQN